MALPSTPAQPANAAPRRAQRVRSWWYRLRHGAPVSAGQIRVRGQLAFWLLSSVPFLVLAWLVHRAGYLADGRAQVISQALVVRRVGIGQNFPNLYPPLPFLTASVAPHALVLGVLSALATGGIVWGIWQHLIQVPSIRMRTRWLLLIAFIITPSMLTLSVTSYGEMAALCLYVLSWLTFQAFASVPNGQAWNAFLAGLLLGIAFYFNGIAVLFLLFYVAALVNYLRLNPDPNDNDAGRMWAAILVLVFPLAAALLIWVFLHWIYTGNLIVLPAGLTITPLQQRLVAAIPQTVGEFISLPVLIAVVFVTALRNPRALVLVLMPVCAVSVARLLGFTFQSGFAQGLYLVTGLVSISRQVPTYRVPALTLGAVAHIILSGAFLWFELRAEPNIDQLLSPQANQPIEAPILDWLANAPPQSVLADDATAYRFIAMHGSAAPFVVPDDALYPLAAYDATSYVDYLLLAAPPQDAATNPLAPTVWQQDRISIRFAQAVPAAFVLIEAVDGWHLYQNMARR